MHSENILSTGDHFDVSDYFAEKLFQHLLWNKIQIICTLTNQSNDILYGLSQGSYIQLTNQWWAYHILGYEKKKKSTHQELCLIGQYS